MYLEIWMLITLAVVFGICAVWNRRAGQFEGMYRTLESLKNDKIIAVHDDGSVTAYRNN